MNIGGIGDARFKEETRRLHDNTCLYVFSDGLDEFPRKNGDIWRLRHFASFLQNHHTRHEHDIDRLITAVEDQRRGDAIDDDVTIMRISFQ